MLTRKQCEEMVTCPGRFKGCTPWTPYYWDVSMDGFGEGLSINGYVYVLCGISKIDCDIFPELSQYSEIVLWENEQGFIYSTYDRDEISKLRVLAGE